MTADRAANVLIANRLNRCALGDHDLLVFNPNGSLDLWIQAKAPAGEQQRNGLLVKAGAPFFAERPSVWA